MKDDPDLWLYDPVNPHFAQLHGIKGVVYSGKTRFQSVEIVETHNFGRCLVLDGKIQSSEGDEFIYHEALVHPSMVLHPHPHKVFIAGGGEGATLREVLAYPSVKRVVMVDIDKKIISLSRKYLPSWHRGSFDDPRVELLYLDARKYLAKCEERIDVIIIDLTEPLKGSPSYLLYTQEFYCLAQGRLNPGGILVTQAGSTSWEEMSLFNAINNTLHSAFPSVLPYQTYIPSFGSPWGFSLASREPIPPLSIEEIDNRISARISKRLRFYDGLTHQSMFSLPKHLREKMTTESRIISDKNPFFLP